MWTPIIEVKQLTTTITGATQKVVEEAIGNDNIGVARAILEIMIMLVWILLVFIVGIGGTIFWILMMVDCANRKFRKPDEKIMWLIIIIISHVIGASIYYFVIKRREESKKR